MERFVEGQASAVDFVANEADGAVDERDVDAARVRGRRREELEVRAVVADLAERAVRRVRRKNRRKSGERKATVPPTLAARLVDDDSVEEGARTVFGGEIEANFRIEAGTFARVAVGPGGENVGALDGETVAERSSVRNGDERFAKERGVRGSVENVDDAGPNFRLNRAAGTVAE